MRFFLHLIYNYVYHISRFSAFTLCPAGERSGTQDLQEGTMRMKNTIRKRFLSAVLAAIMCLSNFNTFALAEDYTGDITEEVYDLGELSGFTDEEYPDDILNAAGLQSLVDPDGEDEGEAEEDEPGEDEENADEDESGEGEENAEEDEENDAESEPVHLSVVLDSWTYADDKAINPVEEDEDSFAIDLSELSDGEEVSFVLKYSIPDGEEDSTDSQDFKIVLNTSLILSKDAKNDQREPLEKNDENNITIPVTLAPGETEGKMTLYFTASESEDTQTISVDGRTYDITMPERQAMEQHPAVTLKVDSKSDSDGKFDLSGAADGSVVSFVPEYAFSDISSLKADDFFYINRLNHKFCGISDSSRSSVGSYRIASERNIRHQDIRIPVCEES